MKSNSTAHVKGDDILQIVEAACALKTLGLKEINNELKSFVTEIAENLYEVAYSFMYEHEYSCCESCDDEESNEENNASPQNTLGNKTMANDDLIIHLSEKDSKIAGAKTIGLSYNKYPLTKPESDGLYLAKVNAEISPQFLFYFLDRDEWARPYDDWMSVSKSNVIGWLKVH